jgi:hypothetical protein
MSNLAMRVLQRKGRLLLFPLENKPRTEKVHLKISVSNKKLIMLCSAPEEDGSKHSGTVGRIVGKRSY